MAETTTAAGCAVCGMQSHPRWLHGCPGVRWYDWAQIPPHLATKTQLQREGLRVARGSDPAGCYIAWTRKTVVYLYDRTAARPKRELSEKQQAALVKSTAALQASRTCSGCHVRVQSKSSLYPVGKQGERLCRDCRREWRREQRERAVYAWAAERLAGTEDGKPITLRILDTETTGLSSDAEVIEVAILDGAGTVLLDTLVKPQEVISEGATQVHGLVDGDLVHAPALPVVWPQIAEALRGAVVLAYNAEFDQRMLQQSAARYGLERIECQWDCLMEACTVFSWDGKHWLPLSEMAFWLQVSAGGHRALGDAQAALGVLRALAARAACEPAQTQPAQAQTQEATR